MAVLLLVAVVEGAGKTAPDPELRRLAQPLVIDESKYGCGPMLRPGKTYYVSVDGDDAADGLSWKTAWRTVNRATRPLKPGDTVLIGEGEYRGPSPSFRASGKPGSPIRLMAAPRCRVTFNRSIMVGPFRKTPGKRFTYEAPLRTLHFPDVWERDSLVKLQKAGTLERVEELPSTFYHDEKARKLYAQFSDGRPGAGRFVEYRRSHTGFSVSREYAHVKGIWCKHGWQGALLRRARHCTVEDCAFFSNVYLGLAVRVRANWCLVKNNYGFNNPVRGTILMKGSAHHNLIIGNRCDSSRPTVRTRASGYHYAMNNYSGGDGPDVFIINNVLNNSLSFRWKPPVKRTVFQGNIAVGTIYSQPARWKDKSDRTIVRNNVILGPIRWAGGLGPGGGNGDWADKAKAFVNNFHASRDPKAVAAARFADPAWLDFRLQSDSPLIGKAIGGTNRGAFPGKAGRVLYVGPSGDDSALGTSERLAFRTLGRAAKALRAGDTLYVMKGSYAEPLVVTASGTEAKPIRVRAYHKERFLLPGIALKGSHLRVEGFNVSGSRGDGILVEGPDVQIERCLVRGCGGAGLRARKAPGLTVNHCTLAGNGVGISLENGTVNATTRSCIVALNREAQTRIDASSRSGHRGYNSLYFGPGADQKRVAAETDSIVADPGFVNASGGDYRVGWDSAARYLGEFARPAGSEPAVARAAKTAGVRVASVQSDSAVALWQTPSFDTTGEIRFRPKGSGKWRSAFDRDQGSDHAAGLTGLKPGTEYEYQIVVKDRRGPGCSTAIRSFRTPARSRKPTRFYVSPEGDDSADGLTPETAWRTIRRACREVQAGDTALVAPGEYRQPISPCRSGARGRRITFKTRGEGEVVLNGLGVYDALVILEKKNYVTVDGFALRVGPCGWVTAPRLMNLRECAGVEILNCKRAVEVKGASCSAGIVAYSCRDLLIRGNVIWGARYSLRLFGCRGTVVENNTLACKSVVTCQVGGGDIKFFNNLLYEPRSFRNAFLWVSKGTKVESDHNLYFVDYRLNPKSKKRLGLGLIGDANKQVANLAEWRRATGLDKRSIEAAPMFVDMAKRDFRLRPGSPAITAGRNGKNIGALGEWRPKQ